MTNIQVPYPAYRPSGIPWLGEIPGHWDVRRIKTLFREKDERNPDGSGELLSLTRLHGLIPQRKASNRIASIEDLSNYKLCRPGDLVMNRMQAWSGMFATPSRDGVISPDYCIFELVCESEVEYFEHLFKTSYLVGQFAQKSRGIGSGFNRLYTEDFGSISVPVPPLPEQAAIVRYLDHVEERTRRYITGKQKLLRLLREEKLTVIRRAVTRGFDLGVPLRPSGNEWLGDMPTHWESRRLKTICGMNSGDGITAMSIESTGTYPVYGGNGLRGYSSHFTHEGEFALIGRQGALCGNVHIARGRFWASEHAVVATLHSGQVLEWFGAILEAMNLNQHSIAAAQPGLAVERILNLWIPVPPPAEQAVIATRIEKQTAVIDTAIKRTRRQIELMQEYRTRLIADVVIGKLDVSGTEADLPV